LPQKGCGMTERKSSWIYHQHRDGKWIGAGKAALKPEELLEDKWQEVKNGDIKAFVIIPTAKYPNSLSPEEVQSLLDNQPEAINGILD
jgi:hypothetical protein